MSRWSVSIRAGHARHMVGGHKCRLQRDHGRLLGLHRRVPHDLQHSDRFDLAISELRDSSGGAREHGPGGMFGIDDVALARQSTRASTRRTRDLDHSLAVTTQEASQPDAVAAGPLDTEPVNRSHRECPSEQLAVSVVGGRDLDVIERAPEPVARERDMRVLMRVDTDHDVARCDAVHWLAFLPRVGGLSPPAVREGQDCDGTWSDQAPMRSPPARPAGCLLTAAPDGRHVNARTPWSIVRRVRPPEATAAAILPTGDHQPADTHSRSCRRRCRSTRPHARR